MERRTFIRLSAYTALALTLPVADGCKSVSKDDVISQPFFFSQLADKKEIIQTGIAYRKLFSAENDKSTLIKALLSDKYAATDKNHIQKLLDEQVKQDFKTGKIITVNGWVLSQTEARQCALYSILNA